VEHFQMGTLREINAETGDTVEVLGGPRWVLTKVDETGFYIDDKVAPKLSETLPFRLIRKGKLMTIADPSSHEDPKKLWLHVKTGCHYKILHHGLNEKDLKPVVIYQAYDGTGPVWVRTAEEFFDGRFRNWE